MNLAGMRLAPCTMSLRLLSKSNSASSPTARLVAILLERFELEWGS